MLYGIVSWIKNLADRCATNAVLFELKNRFLHKIESRYGKDDKAVYEIIK